MKRFAVAGMLLLFACPVLAETYTWTDDSGTVNFSENPASVPKKYRKKMRKVGEDAPPPAEVREAPVEKKAVSHEQKVQEPAARKTEKPAQYGGKDAEVWRRDFGTVRADLKAAEDQLVVARGRVENPGAMSRGEFLGLQYSIRTMENQVLELRGKLKKLEAEADRAEVPADLRQ